MSSDNIVNAKIVNGVSKTGANYKCVEFSIYTPNGVYTTRAFPTPLEIGLIEKTLSKMGSIYSDNESNIF